MNYAVILSGGTGSRMSGLDVPKQYYQVGGRSILSYCAEHVSCLNAMAGYVIVAAETWRDAILDEFADLAAQCPAIREKLYGFADPGENRQESVLHGLYALRDRTEESDVVLIQDAARPLTSGELIERCLTAAGAQDADGAMPVLPMKDTVYYSADGTRIDSLLEREKILAGQAPEAFVYGKYLRAIERLSREELLKINGSSEPAVMAGMRIALVPGDEGNIKITTAADLKEFLRLTGESGAQEDMSLSCHDGGGI